MKDFGELRVRATEGRLEADGGWRPWQVTGPAGVTEIHARDIETACAAVGLPSVDEADEITPDSTGGFILLFSGVEFRLAPSRP